MTYRLTKIDYQEDLKWRRLNLLPMPIDERLRCQGCNGIYWRVFFDRAQCMSCRSFTRLVTEPADGYNDLRSSKWVRLLLEKFEDGRIRDPKSGRPEFVIYKDRLVSRISGTVCYIDSSIKGSWFLGEVHEARKVLKSRDMAEAVAKSSALRKQEARI